MTNEEKIKIIERIKSIERGILTIEKILLTMVRCPKIEENNPGAWEIQVYNLSKLHLRLKDLKDQVANVKKYDPEKIYKKINKKWTKADNIPDKNRKDLHWKLEDII